MNYRTILIAAVFHFVHQVEKDSLRWLDTLFQGHKLRCHKQSFGKIATTVVLDKDENLL